MFTKILHCLKDNGFETFSVGEHKGICKSPYVVIKDNGLKPFAKTSLNSHSLDIIILYPFGEFFRVQPFVNSVILCLSQLNFLKFTQTQSPTVIDPDVHAYTCSLRYNVFTKAL